MYEHEPLKTENPARVTLSLLLPNHCYFPKPLCFQICSTSENVSPGVSGTNTITKITARTTIPTKIKKVTPLPAASAIDMNVCATIKLLIQLTVSDMPPHLPRYCCKYHRPWDWSHSRCKETCYRAKPSTASPPSDGALSS